MFAQEASAPLVARPSNPENVVMGVDMTFPGMAENFSKGNLETLLLFFYLINNDNYARNINLKHVYCI